MPSRVERRSAAVLQAVIVISLLALHPVFGRAQDTARVLTKASIVTLLDGDVAPKRVAEIARERGIGFVLTAAVERELRAVMARKGSSDAEAAALISALRALAKSDTAAPERPTSAPRVSSGQPLTAIDVIGLIVATESSPFLARLARERGIDFTPSAEFLGQLAEVGGTPILVQALRSAKKGPPKAPADRTRTIVGHLHRAWQLQSKGQGADAEKEFRAALALDVTNPVLHIALGENLVTQGQFEGAIEPFRMAVKLAPNSPVAHCDLGFALFSTKKVDDAIAEQRRAIQLDPNYADAHAHLAGELLSTGDFTDAAAEYQKAIDVQMDLNTWRLEFAGVLVGRGDSEGAKRQYRDAITVDPKDPNLHIRLAGLLLRNDKAAALTEYQKATQLRPDDPGLHLDAAADLAGSQAWDEAITEYRAALRLNTSKALDKKGELLLQPADPTTGARTFHLVTGTGIAHRGLGIALVAKGDFDAGLAEVREAIALDKEDALAHQALANALGRKGDWNGAVAAAREAVRIVPDSAEAQNVLGWALNETHDWDAAIAAEREAVRLAPNMASAHNNLAWALEAKGDRRAALPEYQRAHELAPNDAGLTENYNRITGRIAYGSGFSGGNVAVSGTAALLQGRLRLTGADRTFGAGSAFFNAPVKIGSFSTDFTFQLGQANGDGFAFVIQNAGPRALGPAGGGLGYAGDRPTASPPNRIRQSVAIKFDLTDNAGEGINSTGLYIDGASPSVPAIDLTPSGIDLHNGHVFSAHLSYDGSNVSLVLRDTNGSAEFRTGWPINIARMIGSDEAYVGFTGGTGLKTAVQEILTWAFGQRVAESSHGCSRPDSISTTAWNMMSAEAQKAACQ